MGQDMEQGEMFHKPLNGWIPTQIEPDTLGLWIWLRLPPADGDVFLGCGDGFVVPGTFAWPLDDEGKPITSGRPRFHVLHGYKMPTLPTREATHWQPMTKPEAMADEFDAERDLAL